MRIDENGVRLSATDLSHFLSCRHLTALDLAVAFEQRERPPRRSDPLFDLLIERGKQHEAAYVRSLKQSGRQTVDLNDLGPDQTDLALSRTLDAMRNGTEIIVQAALHTNPWFGRADILTRIDVPSALGAWSYEVSDTKLARNTRTGTIIQLGLYSHLLQSIQQTVPERFHVIVPGHNGDTDHHSFRVNDYSAYQRFIQAEMLVAIEAGHEATAAANYPEPVEFCGLCTWWRACDERRRADDHLSLVYSLTRTHRRELEGQGIRTLTSLAGLPVPITFKPKRGSRETYARAHEQARVQLESRGLTTPLYKRRPQEPVAEGTPAVPRGLGKLPEPSPGDVFLDLEGDPYAVEGGREYLFGIATAGDDGKADYKSWWAFTEREERNAFEEVMDFILARLDRHPGAHVYHYAPYEPSAFKKLMGRHATREAELDRLLRGGRLIDLYSVVRQALWIGVESYSIKKLEPAYSFTRDIDLTDASRALHRMEYALQVKQPRMVPDEDRAAIEGYNRDDCVSTLRLRDWLEQVRVEAESSGEPIPRPQPPVEEAPEEVSEKDAAVNELRGRLLQDVDVDDEEPDEDDDVAPDDDDARWLMAYLLDYHRREDKATWWEYFRLREMSEEDLIDERQAVAGLTFAERIDKGRTTQAGKPIGPVIDRYTYPEQEMEIDRGASLMLTDGKAFAEVVAVDRIKRTIDLQKTRPKAEIHPTAVFAFEYVSSKAMETSLFRLGEEIDSMDSLGEMKSAEVDLLLRRVPRLRAGKFAQKPDESPTDFAVRAALNLDRSVLAIQGPPGSGKSHNGAEMIYALVKAGKTVGVTANSHKVILGLLDKVIEAAKRNHIKLHTAHRDHAGENAEGSESGEVQIVANNEEALELLSSGTVKVMGGTAWVWAREEFKDAVDVLFVDEAGQMALANVLAVSQAAKSVVLLGDPQQLEQPRKGSHPDGVGVAALHHILGTRQTISEEHGIFLPTTWRLAPAICEFTSELYYEGRLTSKDGLENQLLRGGDITGAGLFYVPVEHDGNRNFSLEEVETVANLVSRLTSKGVQWQDEDGHRHQVEDEDILVVSPYNSQVNRLSERFEGTEVRVGTVDKFQGKEAPIVIYSMATSRPEDAPRGMEFLYSPNRLNVATSRARCAAILVASPHLYRPECRSIRQLKLANGLCRFRELATVVT